MFLQNMREKTHSFFAYIIVAFLIISFCLWGISSYLHGGFSSDTVAKVNGTKINTRTYVESLNRYKQMQQLNLGADYHLDKQQEFMVKQLVLNNLIGHVALTQYVNKIGFNPSSTQLDTALFSIPAFQQDNAFSPDLFTQYLRAQNSSASQFLADFAQSLAITQWQEGISSTSFVTASEFNQQVALLQQKRDIVFTTLTPDNISSTSKTITEAQIKSYYQQHKAAFQSPEQVSINYVKLSLTDIKSSIQPSSEQLHDYYQQHINQYSQPEQWQVNIIKVTPPAIQAHGGTTASSLLDKAREIADLVKQNKTLPKQLDDQVSYLQKSTWLQANTLAINAKQVLAKLTNPGAVSEPIATGDSYLIYQVLNYKTAQQPNFDQVKAKLTASYIQQQASNTYSQYIDQMTDAAYEQPDSLQQVSELVHQPIKTSQLFTQSGLDKGIASNPQIVNIAFSDDVLLGANNSDVIKLDNGNSAIVLRVAKHEISQTKPFTAVSKQIKILLQTEASKQQLRQQAKRIKTDLAQQSYQQVAKKYQINFTSKNNVGRFSKLSSDGVLQQTFTLGLNQVGKVELSDGSQVIVKVLAIKPGAIADLDTKDKKMYQHMLNSQWSNELLTIYQQAIIKSAKIKRNTASLDRI